MKLRDFDFVTSLQHYEGRSGECERRPTRVRDHRPTKMKKN